MHFTFLSRHTGGDGSENLAVHQQNCSGDTDQQNVAADLSEGGEEETPQQIQETEGEPECQDSGSSQITVDLTALTDHSDAMNKEEESLRESPLPESEQLSDLSHQLQQSSEDSGGEEASGETVETEETIIVSTSDPAEAEQDAVQTDPGTETSEEPEGDRVSTD